MFFAGFWTPWRGVRKVRDGEREYELFGFLTTWPNEIVFPIHEKAMPTILMQRPMDGGSQLLLGILCVWFAEIAISLWSLIWRLSDQSWMLDSPILAALLYLKIIGGTLHVTAPRAVDGRVPRRSWIMLLIGATLAALIAGIIIGSKWSRIIVQYL